MSAAAILIPAVLLLNPFPFVTSSNLPSWLLKKIKVPMPIELTISSGKKSPLISMKAAPVEYLPEQATPASSVTSLNLRLPRF